MTTAALPLASVLLEEFEAQNTTRQGGFDLAGRTAALTRELREPLRAAAPPGETAEELEKRLRRSVENRLLAEVLAYIHGSGVPRAALCLSGGGIRSATFALGVVQGLARKSLLGKFDFLSTVSGGGYLGAWLSAWLFRLRDGGRKNSAEDAAAALAEVERALSEPPSSPVEPEPEPVRYLRGQSRYMSPQLGFLSVDTWTLAATYLRNLLLNWLLFLPLLAALLMLPRLSILLVRAVDWHVLTTRLDGISLALSWLAIGFGAVGIGYVAPCRPSLAGISTFPKKYQSQGWYLVLCQLPLILMAVCITTNWAWFRIREKDIDYLPLLPGVEVPWVSFGIFGVLIHLGGWLYSRIWVHEFRLKEVVIVVVTGFLGGLALEATAVGLFPNLDRVAIANAAATVQATPAAVANQIVLYVFFATPLVLLLYLLASFLFMAFAAAYTNDSDREWMARSAGWLLVTIVIRILFAVIAFLGPALFMQMVNENPLQSVFTSLIGGISGLVTLALGVSSKTGLLSFDQASDKKEKKSIYDVSLAVAAPIFILFLLMLLALGTTLAIEWVAKIPWLHQHLGVAQEFDHINHQANPLYLVALVVFSPGWAVLLVLLLLLACSLLFSYVVDINRFSLHTTYRDRLIRAYLGASRGLGRQAHLFTGFDEADNLRMHQLAANKPLPVINMALNLVGNPLEGQDRKASSFTVSPLHAGSRRLRYRSATVYGSEEGISLGTALAISGAAASPNMGYHSSPVITFLLAMFNVRLGWWLGNPGEAGDRTFADANPKWAAPPLLYEAFGLTRDDNDYVYLSDGGHFENLGLYEMVLRRCRFIVVADAGHDPKFSFDDLGKAITKIRVDFGIPICFHQIGMRPHRPEGDGFTVRSDGHELAPYGAVGHIQYSVVDGTAPADDGLLLYLKPSLNGTEPVNVYQYSRENPQFPHEPTADQFFSESQFECYRSLGEHIMNRILARVPPGAELAQVFAEVSAELAGPRSPAAAAADFRAPDAEPRCAAPQ